MDYQTQKIKELLALIEQNPTLPVVPMVESEIVCDDSCARWKGSWGAAEVTKYICGEEHIFFFDDSDMGEVENTLTEVVAGTGARSTTPTRNGSRSIEASAGQSASQSTSTKQIEGGRHE